MSGRIVGVIGGMGPAATVRFMSRVLDLTPAAREQDHLRLIVDCNPGVPDRNDAARGAGSSPEEVLAGMARGLATAGAKLLAMPCNTAHAYAAAIGAATALPFVNLIEAAGDEVLALGPRRVGILAADGCLAAELYQGALARRGVGFLVLKADEQAAFMALLYRIKAGDTGPAAKAEMAALAASLIGGGAEVILAGCTEIPLVLASDDIAAPMVDSLDALARAAIAAALT